MDVDQAQLCCQYLMIDSDSCSSATAISSPGNRKLDFDQSKHGVSGVVRPPTDASGFHYKD